MPVAPEWGTPLNSRGFLIRSQCGINGGSIPRSFAILFSLELLMLVTPDRDTDKDNDPHDGGWDRRDGGQGLP